MICAPDWVRDLTPSLFPFRKIFEPKRALRWLLNVHDDCGGGKCRGQRTVEFCSVLIASAHSLDATVCRCRPGIFRHLYMPIADRSRSARHFRQWPLGPLLY